MPTIAMPCLQVRLVPRARVVANTWNPNHVSPEKLALLRQSILDNGFCFPIVTIYDPEQDRYVIIDGFHRRLLCEPEGLDVPEVPVVVLAHDLSQRMAATIQFNKARGVHQVDLDAEVIRSLIEQGTSRSISGLTWIPSTAISSSRGLPSCLRRRRTR
jgi:ParB-like chromosome segregation protein Spo0J